MNVEWQTTFGRSWGLNYNHSDDSNESNDDYDTNENNDSDDDENNDGAITNDDIGDNPSRKQRPVLLYARDWIHK